MSKAPVGPVTASAWAVEGRPGAPSTRWYDGRIDAQTNVDHDEAILESGHAAARVGVLLDVSVSLGVAQTPDTSAAVRARRLGIPVVRRTSGGSGLLHMDGDLVWSVILPRPHERLPKDFVHAYESLGAGAVRFLAELGLEAEWSGPFGIVEDFCLLGPRGKVLTIEGHAIGGAAQHVTKSALLHQGMISARLDSHLLHRLFDLDDRMVGRYLTSLHDQGIAEPSHVLGPRLLEQLAMTFEPGAPA
jgi:lipoate-protein ligase A